MTGLLLKTGNFYCRSKLDAWSAEPYQEYCEGNTEFLCTKSEDYTEA